MVDFLSPTQLEVYEQLINDIDIEHKKLEKLKNDIKTQSDKIIIAHLAKSEFSQQISHVNVKVFSDIFSILFLYSDKLEEPFDKLYKSLNNENCKFYLFEILTEKTLQEKIKHTECLLNISIQTIPQNIFINKTFTYKSNNHQSVFQIVAVPNNIIDCIAKVTLIFLFESQHFYVTLDTIHIDISYHFQMIKDKTKSVNKNRQILDLTNLYHNNTLNIKHISKPFLLEYNFKYNSGTSKLMRRFIQNCYHRMDIEVFTELRNDLKDPFLLNFSTGVEKHTLIFDKSNVCQIKASFRYLSVLKKYFCEKNKKPENYKMLDLENNIKDLTSLFEDIQVCSDSELCDFYKNLRKKCSELCI